MNKIKKIILPVLCASFMFSGSIAKSENEGFDFAKVLIGLGLIAWGGLDVHNEMCTAYSTGKAGRPLYFKAQPTVGVIKVALGSVLGAFGLKNLFSTGDKPINTKMVVSEELEQKIKQAAKDGAREALQEKN